MTRSGLGEKDTRSSIQVKSDETRERESSHRMGWE
jgi:hypothetical protein